MEESPCFLMPATLGGRDCVERTNRVESNNAAEERLRLDYEQTLETYRQLADIRFKLLAFVPTLSGVAVALLTNTDLHGTEKVALGAIGFVVTLGIVLYDQRNTQFYNGAISRAQHLEDELGLKRFESDDHGGLFGSRDDHSKRRFLALPIKHDLGLALIYSVVLGAWIFGAVFGGTGSTSGAVAAGGAFAALAFLQFEWLDGQPKRLRQRLRKERKQMDKEELRHINEQFADAEKRRDERFFRDVLSKRLTFRRADGTQVTKQQYLEGLLDQGNIYELLESNEIETIVFDKRTALVSLQVDARGIRSGTSFEGSYRNTRLFVKEGRNWRCAVWFNSREPS